MGTISRPQREALGRAATGLSAAVQRWEIARHRPDFGEAMIAYTEVLWWVIALHDRLLDVAEGYRSDLAKRPHLDEILGGLRHARNRLGHQLADAIRGNGGELTFPVAFPVGFYELEWVSRAQIDSHGGRPGRDAGEAYEKSLAGRPVRHFVTEVSERLFSRPEIKQQP